MSAGEHRGAVNHSIVDEGRYDAQLPFIIRPAELVADATRTLAELLTDWPATFELICDPLERSRPRRRILAASTAILVARSFSSTLYFRSAAMLSILHRFESLRQTRGQFRSFAYQYMSFILVVRRPGGAAVCGWAGGVFPAPSFRVVDYLGHSVFEGPDNPPV
ncbi:hypothetical protein CBI38_31885 (plasmid) [Rhodococcus oxybenzonivorans]|uniref:Uncharacterized protein n=1 Tax=Rhodococcus oxybenzonivorans TaxID=1990687 RepID=A0A2S2C5P6_9NOCA|nr:hypothetical protein [Rhodococcus oxybenzonivorans]AWK76124.1 hypothetical protein CBI38_31885 [Rhodococcus oxybenzonivorans]